MKKQYILYILEDNGYANVLRDFYFFNTLKDAIRFMKSTQQRSYKCVKFRLFKAKILLTDYGFLDDTKEVV